MARTRRRSIRPLPKTGRRRSSGAAERKCVRASKATQPDRGIRAPGEYWKTAPSIWHNYPPMALQWIFAILGFLGRPLLWAWGKIRMAFGRPALAITASPAPWMGWRPCNDNGADGVECLGSWAVTAATDHPFQVVSAHLHLGLRRRAIVGEVAAWLSGPTGTARYVPTSGVMFSKKWPGPIVPFRTRFFVKESWPAGKSKLTVIVFRDNYGRRYRRWLRLESIG